MGWIGIVGLRVSVLVALSIGAITPIVGAQTADEVPSYIKRLVPDSENPAIRRYIEQQKQFRSLEKEMRKLRLHHFLGPRTVALRQEGYAKIREYTDASTFPVLVEVFLNQDADLRRVVLDHFADRQNQDGDATLMWIAVFDKQEASRHGATERLLSRVRSGGRVPDAAQLVIHQGLQSRHEESVTSAARLAEALKLLEAVPWLINAQVVGQQTQFGGNADAPGALAWILVGTQTAFVSDLTPVVGPSAVAFDPQLDVVTEGTILRVIDAVVMTYRVDVHNALIRLTSTEWGQDTSKFGWDLDAWRNWHETEFKPYVAAKRALHAEKARKPAAEPNEQPRRHDGGRSPTSKPGGGAP